MFQSDKEKQDAVSHVESFRTRRVLVIGDVMLDQYTFGQVTRVSPEAPVPVIHKTGESYILGGAANTAHNLRALGAAVSVVGVVGKDSERNTVISLLKKLGITQDLVAVDSRPTTVKHRFVSGAHQLLRMDKEEVTPLASSDQVRLQKRIVALIPEVDVVVISDYAKGCISKKIAAVIIKTARKYKKPVMVDTKPGNKELYVGVTVVTPNMAEGMAMTSKRSVVDIGRALTKQFQSAILLTRGADGMSLFLRQGKTIHIPTDEQRVIDVTGAGDTVLAALSLGVASGLSLEMAARVANIAAGIVITKPGTAVVVLEELLSALEGVAHTAQVKKHEKIWGFEQWLENNDKYCCKILKLNKGYQCSLHYHAVKDEMFLVTKGRVRMEVDGKIKHMHVGNFVRILPGVKHRFMGIEDSEIVEVSTHHEEDDSHRIEKSRKSDEWNTV